MGICWGSSAMSQSTGQGMPSSSNNVPDSSRFSVASGTQSYPDGRILSSPDLRMFSFAELKSATKNFRADNRLAVGSLGGVYKGWLKGPGKNADTATVAVRRLNAETRKAVGNWESEITFLGRLSHPNLVKLLGYCCKKNEVLLVDEHMERGSLENHLYGRGSRSLPWKLRLKIAIGAAKALAFLHESDQLIYIKPSNILLDESHNAKISVFGLARMGSSDFRSPMDLQVKKTGSYIAPEYFATGHPSSTSDVFAFSVVLLELLIDLRLFVANRPYYPLKVVGCIKRRLSGGRMFDEIMDASLKGEYPSRAALEIAQLAVNCIEQQQAKKRPSMEVVLKMLERIEAANE